MQRSSSDVCFTNGVSCLSCLQVDQVFHKIVTTNYSIRADSDSRTLTTRLSI